VYKNRHDDLVSSDEIGAFVNFHSNTVDHYKGLELIEALTNRGHWAGKELPTGYGIELGALYWPTPLGPEHFVSYTDFRAKEKSREHYAGKEPPLNQSPGMVDVDIQWNDVLETRFSEKDQLSFFIANHVFEHLPNPAAFLVTVSQIIKRGGVLMLTIPDAEKIYDKSRPRCTLADLIVASVDSSLHHSKILEYLVHVEKVTEPVALSAAKHKILETVDDPHLWTFDQTTFVPLLGDIFDHFKLPFRVKKSCYNAPFEEIIAFIEKI
jgi:hypothetical protein